MGPPEPLELRELPLISLAEVVEPGPMTRTEAMARRVTRKETALRRFVALLVLTGALAIVPSGPVAAGDGCATHAEYRRVELGMRQARVRHIFGTSGTRLSQHGAREEYAYDGCAFGTVVFVNYRENRVTQKQYVRGE
jgi:hypothetical protein